MPEVEEMVIKPQTSACIYFLQGKVATSEEEEESVVPVHMVNTDIGEMPEGAEVSDGEEPDSRPNDDPHKALDINLDEYVLHRMVLTISVSCLNSYREDKTFTVNATF